VSGPTAAGRVLSSTVALAALALIAAACTGGGDDEDADAITEVTPVIVNSDSELAVGENRFMVGLLSQDNEEVSGAEVAFRFFKLDDGQQELRGEAEATPIAVEKSYTHKHEDGTVETHGAGKSGVYVANVEFDEAGEWGVEVTATIGDKTYNPIGVGFNVLQETGSVPVGAPAPLSHQPTLDDVADVAEIDTSDPPIPEMHALSIAEAVTSGRPTVIVFATPAFCLSRICGPTKQVVDELYDSYKDGANFVHVEPYDIERARNGEGLFPIEASEQWGLESEPWVFLVDSDGTVAAKFEAVVSYEELEQALLPLLDGDGASPGGTIGY
jgi:hypothetical protein